MGQLLTGLSQGRPGLLGWPGFYLLLAAAYAVITLAVLAKLVRRARRPGAAPADNRWLGWLLLLGLAHGLVYSVANPPWFAPDEPSHFEYARLMAGLGRVPTEADISDGLQGEIIGSMYTLDFWRLNRMETPATPPVAFGRGLTGDKRGIPRTFVVNDRFIWYTVQIGNEPSLYYAFVQPAFWPVWGGSDILEQFYRVRWLTLLLYLACVAITFVTARRFMPHLPGGAVGATALVIFHPMLAYIGTSVNNDVAGAALGAAWFSVAAVILLGGWRWRWGLGFVSLTLLAALTKKTTMFLYPLFVVALGLYYLHRRRARLALLGGAATALGAAVVVGALALSNSPGQAVLWVARPDPRLEARSGGQAFEGEHAFRLQAAPSTQELRLNQPLTRQTLNALRGKTVTLQAAVRGGGAEQRGRLGLIDEAGRHTTAFVVGDDWQTVRFEYSVPANTQYLRVALLPGDGSEGGRDEIYFDAVSLRLAGDGETGKNYVNNGSAEDAASLLRSAAFGVAGPLGLSGYILPWFTQPAPRNLPRLVSVALTFAFKTFWGRFGSLTVKMPPWWEGVWLAASAAAPVGLAVYGFRTAAADRARRVYAGLLAAGIAANWLQILLPLLRRPSPTWVPQGRFLFPVVLPVALLFYLAFAQLTPARWRRWLPAGVLVAVFAMDSIALAVLLGYSYG